MKTKVVSFYLNDLEYNIVSDFAEQNNMTKSDIFRFALRTFLANVDKEKQEHWMFALVENAVEKKIELMKKEGML